jgi:hypothetical protein
MAAPNLRLANLALGLVAIAVTAAALTLRGRHDAPAIAPIPPEARILADTTPIDASRLTRYPPATAARVRGGLVSVSAERGLWLTAASALAGCARPVVRVTEARGMPARLAAPPLDGVAVLATEVGAQAVPVADHAPSAAGLAFAMGYPTGRPGEMALKRMAEIPGGDLYAEDGRTEGLGGAGFGAFAGSGVFDAGGRLVGLVAAEEPRRGRVRVLSLAAVRRALAAARWKPEPGAAGRVVTLDNYGVAADELRRVGAAAALICAAE